MALTQNQADAVLQHLRAALSKESQVSLSRRMGATQPEVSRIANAVRPATFEFALALAEAMNISLPQVLGLPTREDAEGWEVLGNIPGYPESEEAVRPLFRPGDDLLWDSMRASRFSYPVPRMTPVLLLDLARWAFEAHNAKDS